MPVVSNRASHLLTPLSLAAVLVACGSGSRQSIADPPEPPPACAGSGAGASGGSGPVESGGSGPVGSGGSGQAGSTPIVETPIDMSPPVVSTPLPVTAVGPFESCGTGEPTVLAKAQSGGGTALAVDDARVYYGTRRGVMTVPIDGGSPELLAASSLPIQIAVNQDAVYVSDNGILRVDKASGQVTILVDQVTAGVAIRGAEVYFSTWALQRTGIGRWADGVIESVVDFGSEEWVPRLVAAEQDLFYVPLSTGDTQPAIRYRLAEKTAQPLAQVNLAGSFAVTGDSFFFTEERTGAIKKVALAGGEPLVLGVFPGSPVAIAADDAHVYFTLHELDSSTHAYSGHVIRVSIDGTSPCDLGAFDGYAAALTVDARYVYWQTSGSADSASAVVMRAVK